MMPSPILILIILIIFIECVSSSAPHDSTVVFAKSEGGYYCHKIPTLLRTVKGTLIALAEGRGRDGRTTCDDFTVSQ